MNEMEREGLCYFILIFIFSVYFPKPELKCHGACFSVIELHCGSKVFIVRLKNMSLSALKVVS